MEQFLPTWQILLVCYGVCYIIQNKIDGQLRGWWLTRDLPDCTFCAGNVSGYFVFVVASYMLAGTGVIERSPAIGGWVQVFLWGLASAAFCIIVDPIARFFEERAPR